MISRRFFRLNPGAAWWASPSKRGGTSARAVRHILTAPLGQAGAAALILTALSLQGGCAGMGGAAHPGNRYEVSGTANEFYKYGPAQAFGPDSTLTKGEKVTMLDRQFGFSQIRLDSGQVGYIATDDLKPAPPDPKPAPPTVRIAHRRSSIPPIPEQALDLTDIPSAPLPE